MKKFITRIYIILMACCSLVLLSGCGNAQSGTGTLPNSTSTAPTTMATPTTVATSTATATQAATCQPSPTVDLNAVAGLSQSAVFYISSQGGIQIWEYGSVLKRYDLATGQTTTLLDYSASRTGILSAQLSPDKRWLALETQSHASSNLVKLLLIGVDGTHLQTLACNTEPDSVDSGKIAWSPNGQELAYNSVSPSAQTAELHVLNLVSGTESVFQQDSYTPFAWLDNQHLLVRNKSWVNLVTSSEKLFLLDTSQSTTQQPQLIASAPALCTSYVLSSDGQKLYSATCTLKGLNNCRSGYGFQGTGSLNAQSSSGGSPSSLYSANNLGILAIQPAGSSILFYSQAAIGDSSLSGLWARDSAGHLTHLLSDRSSSCLDIESFELLPALASNGAFYALYTSGTSTTPQTIQLGSISGGSPTTIATLGVANGILSLVGMG